MKQLRLLLLILPLFAFTASVQAQSCCAKKKAATACTKKAEASSTSVSVATVSTEKATCNTPAPAANMVCVPCPMPPYCAWVPASEAKSAGYAATVGNIMLPANATTTPKSCQPKSCVPSACQGKKEKVTGSMTEVKKEGKKSIL